MPYAFEPRAFPERPGCYLMKDSTGKIIYVGKAKRLRSRLRSYFRKNNIDRKTRNLTAEIVDIEVILVNNEAESLLLENNLIKQHKPKYNRALKKDNSGYAYLQLTDEPLPRFDILYRNRKTEEGRPAHPSMHTGTARRFGPYPNGRFRNALLEFVNEHFQLRSCIRLPKRACLLYHIGKCSGVCEGHISQADYLEAVEEAQALLASRDSELIAELNRKMMRYAERMEFEKAERLMRQIRSLEKLLVKQVVDRDSGTNQDVLYFGECSVMITRLTDEMVRDMTLLAVEGAAVDPCASDRFQVERYKEERPDELIVNRLHDPLFVRKALRNGGNGKVTLTLPKRGLKYELLQLCKQNYEHRVSGNRQAAAASDTAEC